MFSKKFGDSKPPALPTSPPPVETEISYYISLHPTPPATPAPEKPPRVFTETSTSNLDVLNTPSPDSSLAPSDYFQTPPESLHSSPDEPEKSTSSCDKPEKSTSSSDKPEKSTSSPDKPEKSTSSPDEPEKSTSTLDEPEESSSSDVNQKADGDIPTVTVVQAEGDVSGAEDVFQDAEDKSAVLLRAPSMRRRRAQSRAPPAATGASDDSSLKQAVSSKIDRIGSALSRFLDREKSSDARDSERPKSMTESNVTWRNDRKRNDTTEKRNSLIPFGSDFIRRSFRRKTLDLDDEDADRDASPPSSEVSSYRGSIYHEDLVATLMCAACKLYMVGSIEQCKRGHNICKYCWRRSHNYRCPVCKARMSGIRNFLAEDMARKLLFPCAHAHAGCTRQVPNDELEYHQPRCPFRVYSCLINVESGVPCKWEGRRAFLEEHVRGQHSRYYSSQETTTWRWSPNLLIKMEDFQLISAFGELFWYCAAQDPERMRVCWFVQHVGYDQDSVRYEFHFEFTAEDKNRRLEMTCTTLPDYSTVNSIIENGHCLDMSYQQALSFVDEEGTIKFSVTISKLG